MLRSIELFAGAGGLAMGVARTGFKHLAVVEWNRYACDTILENQARRHPFVLDWPLFQMDARNFDYSALEEKVDLVAGGPPCQPFSLGGKHAAHFDSRDMFPEAIRAVRSVKPRAFVFENVKGLMRRSFANYFEYVKLQLTYPEITKRGGEIWENHLARLERYRTGGNHSGLWYKVVARLQNAANFGVPQKRERVFIVGFRSDVCHEWSFPEETHSEEALLHSQWGSGEYWEEHKVPVKERPKRPAEIAFRQSIFPPFQRSPLKRWRTVRDAISDLPSPNTQGTGRILNHLLQPGARSYPGHTGSPIDEPAKTLKAGVHGVPGGENTLRLPDGGIRYFTVRECARLQTFPDDYVFHGSWTEAMRQLGNAVPLDLAAYIVASIRSRLQGSGRTGASL